jgi:hypothetical protein
MLIMLEQNHDKVQDNIMRHKLIVTRMHIVTQKRMKYRVRIYSDGHGWQIFEHKVARDI